MSKEWKLAGASVIGTSHVESNLPCQDALAFSLFSQLHEAEPGKGEEILIVAVSDGAGSALLAERGSHECVQEATHLVSIYLSEGGSLSKVNRAQAEAWIDKIASRIATQAAQAQVDIREYACTLLVAALDAHSGLFLQVGDGAIVVTGMNGQCRPVFWPQSGEYANQTYFITEAEAGDNLQFEILEERISELALFSDGIQSVALHYESRTAHAPFFRPLFNTLCASTPEKSQDLSFALSVFLGSKPINMRTDDDKTLVLATRPIVREVIVNESFNSIGSKEQLPREMSQTDVEKLADEATVNTIED